VPTGTLSVRLEIGAGFASAVFALPATHHKQVTVTSRIASAIPLFCAVLSAPLSADDAVELAASLIGRPYVWGAEGPRAFDCSGLTHYVYGEFGVELPRRAISQSRAGDPVGRRLERGDLLFFASDARRSLVTHVGIYEGGGVMIEASKRYGRVRRDNLEDTYWVERFMFARRMTDGADGRVVRIPENVPQLPRDDRRTVAVRVLEQIAGVLLRRPSR
jgi:hypothetical protein